MFVPLGTIHRNTKKKLAESCKKYLRNEYWMVPPITPGGECGGGAVGQSGGQEPG